MQLQKIKAPLTKAQLAAQKVCQAKVNRYSHHAEHLGFVAYAACETFAFAHAFIYAVAVWLFVTGVWVMITKETSF